ncbi:hypothetical protein NG895_06135 [Aeoliella sp. ICT_H6.2]|uniref:Uncharacterized protein n=1 Tax=Aeoliella straminimaris TaxID=2954799 RepID=A0A9X2JEY4_9BACT|nr:hypothetical protein [Aeoliella straminimaris]MCO6043480.1 hypothetical protein [Aeoliella straminimaris]
MSDPMDTSENPFASPRTPHSIVPAGEPRVVPLGWISLAGLVVGGIAFLVAMRLVPNSMPTAGAHDLRLANNLGFIYPPLVGIWAGWVRRSIPWAAFGVFSGLVIGAAYYALCGYNFLTVMVGFPCLLGGCTSVLLGTKHDSWVEGIPQRFLKGLAAGFALGFVYMFVLNVMAAPGLPSLEAYRDMMWQAGTIAMMTASGVYFVLFHWSAGLWDRGEH